MNVNRRTNDEIARLKKKTTSRNEIDEWIYSDSFILLISITKCRFFSLFSCLLNDHRWFIISTYATIRCWLEDILSFDSRTTKTKTIERCHRELEKYLVMNYYSTSFYQRTLFGSHAGTGAENEKNNRWQWRFGDIWSGHLPRFWSNRRYVSRQKRAKKERINEPKKIAKSINFMLVFESHYLQILPENDLVFFSTKIFSFGSTYVFIIKIWIKVDVCRHIFLSEGKRIFVKKERSIML